jgi:hypothetical protein
MTPFVFPQVGLVPDKVIEGKGFTVMATVLDKGHPASVPFTVYIVVTVGFAVTAAPLVPDNPVGGDHVYVVAPLAESPALPPTQTVPPVVVKVPGGGDVTLTVLVIDVPQTVFVMVTE